MYFYLFLTICASTFVIVRLYLFLPVSLLAYLSLSMIVSLYIYLRVYHSFPPY